MQALRFNQCACDTARRVQHQQPTALLAAPKPRSDPSDGLLYLEVEIPIEWHQPVLRHHQHLVELAVALRGAGLSEALIAGQLETAITSYREALLNAIDKSNDRQPHDARYGLGR